MSTPAALLKFEDLYNEAMEMIKSLNVKVQKNVDNREVYRVSSALISIINTVFIEKGKERFLPMFTTTPYQIVVSFIDTFCKVETRNICITFLEIPTIFPKTLEEAEALSLEDRIRFSSYCKENKISTATLSAIYNISFSKTRYVFMGAPIVMQKGCTGKRVSYMAPYETWAPTAKAVNLVKQLEEYGIPSSPLLVAKIFKSESIKSLAVGLSSYSIHRNVHPVVKTPELVVEYCLQLKDLISRSIYFVHKDTTTYRKGHGYKWVPATIDTADAFTSTNRMATRIIFAVIKEPVKVISRTTCIASFCISELYSIEVFKSALSLLERTINTLNQEGDQGK